MKTIADETICSGCAACTNVCPQHCISMVPNSKNGFLYPSINQETCINCGICKKKCPVLVENLKTECKDVNPSVYMGWTLDKETRSTSTSGGAFSEIASYIYDQGGYVAGAVYDDYFNVVHFISNNKEDLKKLRQSKYCQSIKNDIYIQVKEKLDEGHIVLFAGTPCECQALKSVLRHDYSKLILCDLVCLGAASPKAYKMYIKELTENFNTDVEQIWFKDKTKGWDLFSTKVIFKNHSIYRKDRYADMYMIGYAENQLFLRESCTNCAFRKKYHATDLTLADFWGIEIPNSQKQKGVSLIITNSEMGESIIKGIENRMHLEKRSYLEATNKSNPAIYKQPVLNPNSDLFYKMLDEGFSKAVLATRKKRTVKQYIYIWMLRLKLFGVYRKIKTFFIRA